jgi:hypothetical protein
MQFTTTRDDIFNEYAAEKRQFGCSTRPYISVQTVVFDVLNALPAGAVVMAHAVAKAKQELVWFGFGDGDTLQIGSEAIPITKKATDADTNLSSGHKTNGVEDFVIEAISSSVQGMRIVYDDADLAALGTLDGTVQGAYKGRIKLVDPAALVAPPQFGSPLNLEDVFYEAVAAKISAKLVWDKKGFIPVGTMDQFPEGGARSIIRAHGDPRVDNRYKIPEGYAWRRVDKTDGEFSVQGKLEDAVVIPITLVALQGEETPLVVPSQIFVDIRMRLHGLGFGKPGRNNF